MPEVTRGNDLVEAVSVLAGFIGDDSLTSTIAELERALEGAASEDIHGLLEGADMQPKLLPAALLVRDRLGRINDVVHASAIALALPALLEPGEILRRPSLAAGNDPSRPFDVETDRRIAEFKLARWRGSDAARKRSTFKDLVHLAADESGKAAQLYVRGQLPVRFLSQAASSAEWALERPSNRKLFGERFGDLSMSIASFTGGPGAHVEIIDLEDRLPDLFG